MQNKWVAAVVGDIDGANELIPAMKILGSEKVQWFVDPGREARAGLVLDTARIVYERRFPKISDHPAVIVVGTSRTAIDAQIAWTMYGHASAREIPVYWVENFFGTGSCKASQKTAPDVMLTIHPIAEGIARNVRMDLPTKTVGKPSFSYIPWLIAKRLEIREQARRKLKIMEGEFLVHWIFTEAPAERPWRQIDSFRSAMNQFAQSNALMMPRFHPKHLERVRLEAEMKEILGDQFVAPAIGCDSAIAASDLVVADWGAPQAFTALFLGVPVATTLFPNDFDERVENGFIGGIPPILMRTEGAYSDWGLSRPADICGRIRYIKQQQEFAALITQNRAHRFRGMYETGAAKRIADEISTHLK